MPRFEDVEPPRFAEDPRAWVWYRSGGKLDAYCVRDGEWIWFRLERLASYRFPAEPVDGTLDCVAVPDAGADRSVVVDQFYRSVTPYALEAYGFESVHGCAVMTVAGALVLAAPSRAGKTTLALALAQRGHDLIADDAVILDPFPGTGEDRPSLRPLPFVPRARTETAVRYGLPVRERLAPPQGPVTLGDPVPLAAFVLVQRHLPQKDGVVATAAEQTAVARPELARLGPGEAFKRLLRGAHFIAPDELSGDRRSLAAYLRMTARVPVYTLSYPSGFEHLEEAADVLERLVVEELAPRAGATLAAGRPRLS